MPECKPALPGSADTLPGHALIADGKPHCLRREGGFLVDAVTAGPNGYGLCECARGSGWKTSDKARRQWHACHLRDERFKAEDRARRRLLARRSAVVEVQRHRQGGHEDGGKGGGGVKGSQATGHWSSRCGKRARECVPHSPLCAAERRFPPPVTW